MVTNVASRDEIVKAVKSARRRKFWAGVGKFVTATITGALASFAGGWELMLGVGVIHAEWIRTLPTIGYWWAVLLVWLLRGTFSRIAPSKDKAEVRS